MSKEPSKAALELSRAGHTHSNMRTHADSPPHTHLARLQGLSKRERPCLDMRGVGIAAVEGPCAPLRPRGPCRRLYGPSMCVVVRPCALCSCRMLLWPTRLCCSEAVRVVQSHHTRSEATRGLLAHTDNEAHLSKKLRACRSNEVAACCGSPFARRSCLACVVQSHHTRCDTRHADLS